MGIIHYKCKGCNKDLGFVIDDKDVIGEKVQYINGLCCNRFYYDVENKLKTVGGGCHVKIRPSVLRF